MRGKAETSKGEGLRRRALRETVEEEKAVNPRAIDSCSFLPCDQVSECCLVGGCVQSRFAKQFAQQRQNAVSQEALRDDAPALNGTEPARTNRDPALIKRQRKALRP